MEKYLHTLINSDKPITDVNYFNNEENHGEKKLTARTADINQLYEESVQCPEFEVVFIKNI